MIDHITSGVTIGGKVMSEACRVWGLFRCEFSCYKHGRHCASNNAWWVCTDYHPSWRAVKVVQRYHDTWKHARLRDYSRSRHTTDAEDRFLCLRAVRDHHSTTRHLQIQLREVQRTSVSDNLIRRHLAEHDSRPWRLIIGPRHTR